VKNKHKNA